MLKALTHRYYDYFWFALCTACVIMYNAATATSLHGATGWGVRGGNGYVGGESWVTYANSGIWGVGAAVSVHVTLTGIRDERRPEVALVSKHE